MFRGDDAGETSGRPSVAQNQGCISGPTSELWLRICIYMLTSGVNIAFQQR